LDKGHLHWGRAGESPLLGCPSQENNAMVCNGLQWCLCSTFTVELILVLYDDKNDGYAMVFFDMQSRDFDSSSLW
jgi:hypothetical protein